VCNYSRPRKRTPSPALRAPSPVNGGEEIRWVMESHLQIYKNNGQASPPPFTGEGARRAGEGVFHATKSSSGVTILSTEKLLSLPLQ
jgi:hypothetical protein